MHFLIQGLFFQEQALLDIEQDFAASDKAFFWEGLVRVMFAGVIFTQPNDKFDACTGYVQDVFGFAELSGVELTDNSLRFIKMYEKRDDPINFNFKRKGDWWIGEWEGSIVGRGIARCVLTEVAEDFFDPE